LSTIQNESSKAGVESFIGILTQHAKKLDVKYSLILDKISEAGGIEIALKRNEKISHAALI
jgi:hypothetical protein